MKEIVHLRQMEADCRQRAVTDPEKQWYWLAQAARYQFQLDVEIASDVEECNRDEFIPPEIRLAEWPMEHERRP
jgi:hypothetical protein